MPSHDRTQTLVLDTAPLLTSTLSSLLAFSNRFVTTQEVIEEVRAKGQRERLEQEWKTLHATLAIPNGTKSDYKHWQGLQIRQPSLAGIAKIKEFASKTGDIAVLSTADIGVLALAYDVEVEANGIWRLRDTVGAKRLGKDPEKKKARLLRKQLERSSDNPNAGPASPGQPSGSPPQNTNAASASSTMALDVKTGSEEVDRLASQASLLALDAAATTSTQHLSEPAPASADKDAYGQITEPTPKADCEESHPPDTASDADWVQVPIKIASKPSEGADGGSDTSSFVSASDPTWVTPENIHIHQAKDMGFFPSLAPKPLTRTPDPASSIPPSSVAVETEKTSNVGTHTTGDEDPSKAPTMKAALLTGDFAMQNVALQIGLNVLGVGGRRVRDVKTWVLRCHACFKLCKDPTRKFCPTCGGPTLTRVSITYTPSSPSGYVLHLKPNFQYRNRGTVYSIPSAKPGSASFEKGGARQKGVNGATLILREDQKEFQRGLKSAEIRKQKEERSLVKANQERKNWNEPFGTLSGAAWNDPDWEAPMLMGEKGRRGAGRHQSREARCGKDGLPIIGFGKNPNQVRRQR